jgi:hypothetical protein
MTSEKPQATQEPETREATAQEDTADEALLPHALVVAAKHIHREAMAQCDAAHEARRGGETDKAMELFAVALEREQCAVALVGLIPNYADQAILFHSAGELAANVSLLQQGRWYERPHSIPEEECPPHTRGLLNALALAVHKARLLEGDSTTKRMLAAILSQLGMTSDEGTLYIDELLRLVHSEDK